MTRPAIRKGDVVRIAKRFKNHYSRYAGKSFVVRRVCGDGSEGHSKVYVYCVHSNHVQATHFRRKELWRTGYNILDAGKEFEFIKGGYRKNSGPPPLPAPPPVYIPPPSKTDVKELVEFSFKMMKNKSRHKETKCQCGRMADIGRPCWWCGRQN